MLQEPDQTAVVNIQINTGENTQTQCMDHFLPSCFINRCGFIFKEVHLEAAAGSRHRSDPCGADGLGPGPGRLGEAQ